MSKIDHQAAVALVEFYLEAKGKTVSYTNTFQFSPEFNNKHKLGTSSRPNIRHSYDILTADHILIEIDDYGKHSKKAQKINDGIANDYAETHLVPKGYKFYRLLKEEIVNEKGVKQPDAYSYLREHLF